MDQHSLVQSQQHELVARMDPALRAKIKMYTQWLPLSPSISSIGRLLLGQVRLCDLQIKTDHFCILNHAENIG